MTFPAPVRFALWVLGGMTPYRAGDPRLQDRMAAMHIWPERRRGVRAEGIPNQSPRAVSAAVGATHEERTHEHSR